MSSKIASAWSYMADRQQYTHKESNWIISKWTPRQWHVYPGHESRAVFYRTLWEFRTLKEAQHFVETVHEPLRILSLLYQGIIGEGKQREDMGVNYYLYENECIHCDRNTSIHIGKSTYGWCFALHVIPEMGINSLEDWKARWSKKNSYIRNDSYALISPFEMERIITKRFSHRMWEPIVDRAASVADRPDVWLGPNGLFRLAATATIKHGETWDLVEGDFS